MNARIEPTNFALRACAKEVAEQAELQPLREIWTQLVQGACGIKDAFSDAETCHLVLSRAARKAALRPLRVEVLEKVLCGAGQKLVAIDHNLSCSTIATIARQALAELGLNCLPSRVPLALVLAAQASCESNQHLSAKVAHFLSDGEEYCVVRMPRPDCRLDEWLSPAEVEVVRARIEGCSHRNIAGLRRTSPRTVANQLASAARRLGSSGRLEIISRLMAPSAQL
jgi:DNA-binding NarL/FixJ family response regulator